jgi:hypothetical protein
MTLDQRIHSKVTQRRPHSPEPGADNPPIRGPGRNFIPAYLPGSFFVEIFRAAAFIAALTSTQVPMGVPQALHDMIMSSVGASGMSSRPPHFSHLNLRTDVILG